MSSAIEKSAYEIGALTAIICEMCPDPAAEARKYSERARQLSEGDYALWRAEFSARLADALRQEADRRTRFKGAA